VPIVKKKRRDAAELLTGGRVLAEAVVRDADEPAGRAERLAAGLAALWPAPLTAALLSGGGEAALVIRDEAGHPRPDWHDPLRPQLTAWAAEAGPVSPAAVPSGAGLTGHALHGSAVGWGARRYGSLALALHKRSADASLAQVLLTHLADHLGFRLFQEEADRQGQARYRDLADLTNLVGHEFNNALNAVGLQVAAMKHKGLKPEQFPELGEVRRGVAEAGQMVRRLQDFCYKGSPPRLPSDLNRAVRASVAADAALAGRALLELGAGLPRVQGTALDLERLAAALLRGAAAAAPPTPGAVTVRTGKGTGAVVWLRVEDAGPEPDAEQLPRLFEPFVPLRAGDDGVALALAKGIARRLGGSLRGEKRAGGGMAFVVELRAAEEAPA
jgi:signal transduction histidine kinase